MADPAYQFVEPDRTCTIVIPAGELRYRVFGPYRDELRQAAARILADLQDWHNREAADE